MKLLHLGKLSLNRWWRSPPTPHSPSKPSACIRHPSRGRSPLVLLVFSITTLTGVIGHRFYNEPQLAVGRPAPETILAPRNASIEDEAATAAARQAARPNVLSVLMVNADRTQQIQASFEQQLTEMNELRQLAGEFPFLNPGQISTPVQRYLRQINATTLDELLSPTQASTGSSHSDADPEPAIVQKARTELFTYQEQLQDAADWSGQLQVIKEAQQRYQLALEFGGSSLSSVARSQLLTLTDADWRQVQTLLKQVLQRILAQGVPPGLPPLVIRDAVQVHLNESAPAVQALGLSVLPTVLKPNLAIDPAGTQAKLIEEVPPVMVTIRTGEVIVQAGKTITPAQFLLLDYFSLSRREINWFGLLGTTLLVSGGIALFLVAQARTRTNLSRRDYFLILLLSVSAPLIAWTTAPRFTSLPAVGLLVGSFYGSVLGAMVILLLTALMPLGLASGAIVELLAVAAGSLVGSIAARQPRSREELALLGLIVALTQGITYFLLMTATGGAVYGVLGMALIQGGIGLAWSIVALGVSPYLEHVFDLVTPIRLAELANPNRPMLQRLAQETPGTFQHTLLVATLAEAGARALGCNVELVRTGTLYHDIGKMHDPQAFIENQLDGTNKHDQLQDPWQSAAIIKKHVTEGLVMARKCRLPTAVQAFIPEHQGTMLVAYFYHQAQQLVADNPELGPVQEVDFRYEGPAPQSRETGIVMLADSCEAALRSLKEGSTDQALQMVNKIFKGRWKDNQLVASRLTRADLDILAEVFVKVWLQFHHKRIPYPSRTKGIPRLPEKI